MYIPVIMWSILGGSCILVLYSFLQYVKWWLHRKLLYDNYVTLSVLLEDKNNVAYTKIFQDDMIVYFASEYRTNQDDMKKLQKKFVKLVISFLGPNILKDVTDLYGSDEAFYSYLITYFNNRATADESEILNSKVNIDDEYLKQGVEYIKNKNKPINRTPEEEYNKK